MFQSSCIARAQSREKVMSSTYEFNFSNQLIKYAERDFVLLELIFADISSSLDPALSISCNSTGTESGNGRRFKWENCT